MAMNDNIQKTLDNPVVTILARLSSLLATAIGGIALWIFLQMWGDLKSQNETFTAKLDVISQQQVDIRIAAEAVKVRVDAMGNRVDDLREDVNSLQRARQRANEGSAPTNR